MRRTKRVVLVWAMILSLMADSVAAYGWGCRWRRCCRPCECCQSCCETSPCASACSGCAAAAPSDTQSSPSAAPDASSTLPPVRKSPLPCIPGRSNSARRSVALPRRRNRRRCPRAEETAPVAPPAVKTPSVAPPAVTPTGCSSCRDAAGHSRAAEGTGQDAQGNNSRRHFQRAAEASPEGAGSEGTAEGSCKAGDT